MNGINQFSIYTGSGVCDVCNRPLGGIAAYVVPNNTFYASPKWRAHYRATTGAMCGMPVNDSIFEMLRLQDKSQGSAVCESCIHMFLSESVQQKQQTKRQPETNSEPKQQSLPKTNYIADSASEFCSFCGNKLPLNLTFCPFCGSALHGAPTDAVSYAQPQTFHTVPVATATVPNSTGAPAYSKPPTPKSAGNRFNKWGKKKVLIGGGAALVVLLSAIIISVSLHNKKQFSYNEGATLIENGDYVAAYAIFTSLKGFDDSEQVAAFCDDMIRYQKAKTLMKNQNYSDAKTILKDLGSFEDAASLAKKCQQATDYENAQKLFAAKDFASAKEAFIAAGDYKDAPARAEECDKEPEYAKAQTAYANEEYYTAYNLFIELGDFKDSTAMAQRCIISPPPTGPIYQNSAYNSTACFLDIMPPASDGSSTYIKIYTVDGILVSSAFINPGDSVSINLSAGQYKIKSAYGYSKWFGEKDMFGDEGTYQLLKIDDTNEVFTMENNYTYTLTLRTGGITTGDDVGTEEQNREDF